MLLSYTIVDFYFYYNNGAVDMQICTLLTRIQCKVSDTQVTVKACGPLVKKMTNVEPDANFSKKLKLGVVVL